MVLTTIERGPRLARAAADGQYARAMFGRSDKSSTPEPTDAGGASSDAGQEAGKGRPTPSRREAEAARKQQIKIPKDPKAAKKAAPKAEAAAE